MTKYQELEQIKFTFVNGEEHHAGEYYKTLSFSIKQALSKYPQKNVDKEQLLKIAAYGLWKAAKTYDPNKGVLFQTYAQYYVDNEVNTFLKNDTNVLNNSISGSNSGLTVGEYKTNVIKFQQEFNREPNEQELLEYAGVKQTNCFNSFNLVSIMDAKDDEESPYEFIDEDNNPLEEYEYNERQELIKKKNNEVRAILTKKENEFMEYRVLGYSDAEIARRLKIYPSQVSTMYFKILRKTKNAGIKGLNGIA